MINGGTGPNRNVDRIILESPLVQVYRNLHTAFEKNFMHAHLTSQHAEANMAKTFHEVCKHLSEHSPHTVQAGRKSLYIIPDLMSQGVGLMSKVGGDNIQDSSEEDRATFEDVIVEIGV